MRYGLPGLGGPFWTTWPRAPIPKDLDHQKSNPPLSAQSRCEERIRVEFYLLAAVEDMLTEAHKSADDSRWSAASFLAGFGLFLLVSQTMR